MLHAILGAVMLGVLALFVAPAEAATFKWNRGAEADLDHYEMYACTQSATCDPIVEGSRIGQNIPQTAAGVDPSMTVPNTPLSGRAAVLAADRVGNKSPGSNVVPFRAQALGATTGLQVLP